MSDWQVTESIARMQVLCNGLKQPFGSTTTHVTPHADVVSMTKDSARYDSCTVSALPL